MTGQSAGLSESMPNKSLDRSADSLFLNLIGAAKVGCNRRARSTQTLGETGIDMPTLDDVYRKFGETAEAAQLLETDLGTIALMIGCTGADLLENPDSQKATEIYQRINRQTLGQLLKNVRGSTETLDHLADVLDCALKARNKLSHSFYRRHNFRRNSDEGRKVMLDDLEAMHVTIFNAWKAVLLLSGVDLDAIDYDAVDLDDLPKQHVPI